MSKIIDNGWLLALIFSIACVILIIISLVPPWYHQTSQTEFLGSEMELGIDYTLWGIRGGVIEMVEDDGELSYDSDEMKDKEQAKVFITTARILAIGLLMSITLIFASMFAANKNILRMRAAVIIALIACILTIMAPLYLMAALPGAFEEDRSGPADESLGPEDSFFGSETDDSLGVETVNTWGPKAGWYLSLIAGILNLMVFITLIWFMKGPMPLAPVQSQAWQQRSYPPPPSQYPPQQPSQYPPQQPPSQYPPQQPPQQPPQYPPQQPPPQYQSPPPSQYPPQPPPQYPPQPPPQYPPQPPPQYPPRPPSQYQ